MCRGLKMGSPSPYDEGHLAAAPPPARANLLRVPDAVNTAAALDWLEEWLLRAGGSTRLLPALQTALRYVSRSSANMQPTC
jgi:hypothetical protein